MMDVTKIANCAEWCESKARFVWADGEFQSRAGSGNHLPGAPPLPGIRDELALMLAEIDPALVNLLDNPFCWREPEGAASRLLRVAETLRAMIPAAEPVPIVAVARSVDSELVGRTLALCGDGRALQIANVAKDKTKSAEDRMIAIVEIDERYEGFNSPKWAELLDVTPDNIRGTQFWKDRKSRKEWAE